MKYTAVTVFINQLNVIVSSYNLDSNLQNELSTTNILRI